MNVHVIAGTYELFRHFLPFLFSPFRRTCAEAPLLAWSGPLSLRRITQMYVADANHPSCYHATTADTADWSHNCIRIFVDLASSLPLRFIPMSSDQASPELTTRDVLAQVGRRIELLETDIRTIDSKVDLLSEKIDTRFRHLTTTIVAAAGVLVAIVGAFAAYLT